MDPKVVAQQMQVAQIQAVQQQKAQQQFADLVKDIFLRITPWGEFPIETLEEGTATLTKQAFRIALIHAQTVRECMKNASQTASERSV